MGDVAIQYRVLPDSPDANIDEITAKIKAALPEGVKIHKLTTKPFAFGLSAIEILVVMKDTGGLSEKTEEALSGVEGIQGVELLEMSLI
jgi:elongation factor 1-beta